MTEPLRILALLEADSISGTAKAVLEMAYEARADTSGQRAIAVAVANFRRGGDGAENPLTRALDGAQIPNSFIREQGRFDASVLPQIRDLARRYEAHAIWTNSVKSHFLVSKAGVGKQCRWAAFHHGYTSTDFKMRLYNQLDHVSLRKADRVLTVCEPFARQMEARGVNARRIRVQHMPIRPFANTPDDRFVLRNELNVGRGDTVILSVGRLSQEKGHVHLIRAFAELRNELPKQRVWLIMVGDGPERQKLEQEAERLRCHPQVIFTGQREDAKRFYGIADVFALPSYTEGTPNVLLEALAAGVPVVATEVGGILELVTNGRNALLVRPGEARELAGAIAKLLQSAELRNEVTTAGAEVVAVHSPASYFRSMRTIFFEMVSGE